MIEGEKFDRKDTLVSHMALNTLLFGLALLVQGCAPWQPPFPTPALLDARCGQTSPCSPCADAPAQGRCPAGCACGEVLRLLGAVAPSPAPLSPSVAAAEAQTRGEKWDCNDSKHEGEQMWTCHEGLLYRCEGGKVVKIHCHKGCETIAKGMDDVCVPLFR